MQLKKTPFVLAMIVLCGAIPRGAQAAAITIEAESMTLSGYVIENASRIRLSLATGTATKAFSGPSGTYDMQVFVIPETDGRSTLAVYKGTTATTPLLTYTYPLGSTPTSFTIKNVALNTNDTIKLVGKQNAGAIARVDKIVLTQVATTTPATGTPPPYTGTPYSGTPVALPKAFEASKFDKGGQNVAYKDLTAGNAGGQFRTSEDVDIIASTDTQGGPYAVNNFQTGEWLAYTVNVPSNANYDLAIRASSNQATPAVFHMEVDGANVTGSIPVPKSVNWTTFQWVGKQNVPLTAGKHVVKVVSEQQYFNMSALSVLASASQPTSTTTTGGTAPTVALTAPASGQTVSGTAVPYAATVGSTVTKVDFSVSSSTPIALGTKTAAPFGGTLDTTKLANGSHTLTAVATDAQGKTSTSQVAFTVQNSATTTAGGTTTKPASLLFWSGFESGVSVAAPRDCWSAGCWQDLLGADASGFSWPPKIAGIPTSTFQARSGTNSVPTPTVSTISNFIVNEIQTVTGRTGAATRAHHVLIKKTGCTGTATINGTDCSAQDPYLLQPTSEPGDLYISFWRKLDPSLLKKLVNGWHVVFEWKSVGDYRINAQIVNYGGVTPYWQLNADNVANGGLAYQSFWRVENHTVPVPIGQWFKFEVFTHRSKGSDGRVWIAVNGQKLVDKFGPNYGVRGDRIDRIFLMQLYSAATYPLEQWTDDVQIWRTFPTAKAGDPWYDGVYAPH